MDSAAGTDADDAAYGCRSSDGCSGVSRSWCMRFCQGVECMHVRLHSARPALTGRPGESPVRAATVDDVDGVTACPITPALGLLMGTPG